jgi:hypothetical protein
MQGGLGGSKTPRRLVSFSLVGMPGIYYIVVWGLQCALWIYSPLKYPLVVVF